jgi:hypothetical protein
MTEGVSVDLGALTQFAAEAGALGDAHVKNQTAQLSLFFGLSSTMKGLTGAVDPDPNQCTAPHGFSEAQDFTTRHAAMVSSATEFMADVLQGMASLSAGAQTCAVRYASTDQLNAAVLASVHAGPEATSGRAGLLPHLEGTATVTADAVRDSFVPSTADEALFRTPVAAPGQAPESGAAAPLDPATAAALDKTFAEKVAQERSAQTQPGSATPAPNDLGAGQTLGKAPITLVVPADQVRMPDRPQIPSPPAD